MQDPKTPLSPTVRLALTVGLAAAFALIVVAVARRFRPSGISRALESEDRAFEDTELGAEIAAFDDRVAPGAPL